jgi:hypothetical protein
MPDLTFGLGDLLDRLSRRHDRAQTFAPSEHIERLVDGVE